tara:strand:- start:1870 stop:4968 length:3099 start_codon:yes stop_codon:yes gene_type:complete
MSLVNLQTNLKSLKFGKDRPGEGSSNQPYITTPIPGTNEPLPEKDINATDFLLRGGIEAASDSAIDVVRLGKFFSDFKGAQGPLFVAKQNSLSQISVRTQASGNGTDAGVNEGVYTPLSTLAQAGINFIGGHVDKQGINIFKGVTLYGPAGVKNTNANTVINQVIGGSSGKGNRLVDLTNEHEGKNSGVNVLSYFGGPNSVLGATNTNIKFATDNTGASLKVLGNEELTESFIKNQTGLKGSDTSREGLVENKFRAPLGASIKYTKNNNGEVIIENGTAEAFIMGGDNEGTLAFINAENGITWANADGTPPTPKLQNPTNLFVIPGLFSGNDIVNKYRIQTGEDIKSSLLKDDGISWRENLTNPYATGVKGTLAKKEYVPRDFKIANPTELFQAGLGVTIDYNTKATKLGLPLEELASSPLEKNNGISWMLELTNPYATGVKGSLSSKKYVSRNFNLQNPMGLFVYNSSDNTPQGQFLKANPGYVGIANDDIINASDHWRVNPKIVLPKATGANPLASNKYVNIGTRKASYGLSGDNRYRSNWMKDSQILPLSLTYQRYTGRNIIFSNQNSPYVITSNNFNSPNAYTFNPNAITSVYQNGTLNPSLKIKNPKDYGFGNQNYKTLNQNQLYSFAKTFKDNPGRVTDFRKTLLKGEKKSTIMSIAPNYGGAVGGATVDSREGTNLYHYTSPGQKGDIISYTKGKILPSGELSVADRVNYYSIYQSEQARSDIQVGDLINFRIGAINQKNPKLKDYIHFRAYIDSFGDSYTGNWDSIKYMGRAEPFYKYNSFERKISLSFTVAAQSREELHEQYRKLNYLVSNLAPDYSEQGYMAGSLVTLTMGNWCFELPGFIEQLSLDIPEESPWEIGIDDNGVRDNEEGIMQLPHIIKVTGFSFQPIHTFRPAKERLTFATANTTAPGQEAGDLSSYGEEKYIAYRGKITPVKPEDDTQDDTQSTEDEEFEIDLIDPPEDNEEEFVDPYADFNVPVGVDNNEFTDYNTIPQGYSYQNGVVIKHDPLDPTNDLLNTRTLTGDF